MNAVIGMGFSAVIGGGLGLSSYYLSFVFYSGDSVIKRTLYGYLILGVISGLCWWGVHPYPYQ